MASGGGTGLGEDVSVHLPGAEVSEVQAPVGGGHEALAEGQGGLREPYESPPFTEDETEAGGS